MFEVTKQFRFEAAHTLQHTSYGDASRRVHGHSFRVEVAIRGQPSVATGMLVDLSALERSMVTVRDALDHRLLDDVDNLGPATLENLSAWIWRHVTPIAAGLHRVTVHRDSCGESCTYYGPQGGSA